jgi:hypothetical protein
MFEKWHLLGIFKPPAERDEAKTGANMLLNVAT